MAMKTWLSTVDEVRVWPLSGRPSTASVPNPSSAIEARSRSPSSAAISVSAEAVRSAGTTTSSNSTPDGRRTSFPTEHSAGPPRRDASTPPNRPGIRYDVTRYAMLTMGLDQRCPGCVSRSRPWPLWLPWTTTVICRLVWLSRGRADSLDVGRGACRTPSRPWTAPAAATRTRAVGSRCR